MTEQHTNPLIGSKGDASRKATVADLEAGVVRLNIDAANNDNPYRFAMVPNEKGKMCIRKVWPGGRIEKT